MSDRDGGAAARDRLRERPNGLIAAGRRDRDPDPRPLPVGVTLVVERYGNSGEAPPGQRRGVGTPQRRHRLEQRALRGVELALAGPKPPVLDERLEPVE